jgi:hypothetical protein
MTCPIDMAQRQYAHDQGQLGEALEWYDQRLADLLLVNDKSIIDLLEQRIADLIDDDPDNLLLKLLVQAWKDGMDEANAILCPYDDAVAKIVEATDDF